MKLNGVLNDLKTQWENAVNAFRAKEMQFKNAMAELVKNKDKYYTAGLKNQYDALLTRGNQINTAVGGVLNTINEVYGWFKEQFGMGILPAIPFAALATVGGIIAAFLLSYAALNKAMLEYQIRQLPPEKQEAARQTLINNSGSVTSDIKNTVIGLAVIAVAVFVLPKIFKESKD